MDGFLRINTNSDVQDGGPRFPPFRNDYAIITSSPHDADFEEDVYQHTIHPPNFVVIAFIFSELRKGGGIPHPSPLGHRIIFA